MPEPFSEPSRDPGVPDSAPATGRALVPLTMPVSAHAPAFRHDVVTTYADASARDKPPIAANGAALSRVA
jgi:hypothetical protein